MENIIAYRRALHAMPETARREDKTGEYIARHLSGLGCEVERVVGTGSLAFFDNGGDETIAFRADIDALPIAEETGLPFASQNGCMHACGHDAHMAMLLGLADHIAGHRGDYRKNILLIFQPSEETIGGARPICETGVLERRRVRCVFGLHVWPKAKAGAICTRPGPLMAKASEMTLTVHGKSAHCARPELGVDALAAAADIVSRLNRFKREEIAPGTEYLMHFGTFRAGDAGNIVCETAQVCGSVRAFSSDVFDMLAAKIRSVAAETDALYGTRTEIDITEGYPTVTNDPELTAQYKQALEQAGIEVLEAEKTVISEDFSEYQLRVPGVFGFLGLGDVPSLHNNRFDFDESLMDVGVRAFIALLERFAR